MNDDGAATAGASPAPTDFDERDLRLAALLDRYVDALHRRDGESCTLVLAQHPELVELLRCLNALESIAPRDAEADGACGRRRRRLSRRGDLEEGRRRPDLPDAPLASRMS